MSTTTGPARPSTAPDGAPADGTAPGLGTLTGVELRKATDTRAGFWLMVVIALASLVITAVQVFASGQDAGDYAMWLVVQQIPVGFLVPVLAILVVTSEWSARTALSTFTLVPRRQRVLRAKLVAVLLMAVAAFVVSAAFTALGTAVGSAVQDAPSDWSLTWWQVLQPFVLLLVNVLVGFALALLLLSSPIAIVIFFLVPTVLPIVFALVSSLQDVGPWVDFSTALAPVTGGQQLSTVEWAHVAVTSAIWALLPAVLGARRVQRAEIT